ncbi:MULTISPECIES: hypothetical protein [Okeania]|uniref:Uncharacterized protein n=1 Tax=Okeania hirsuta TaxID=1458930 RepID=A0A3N6NTD0_9CYAN|nr:MULTISPECIES: hypothetical protein [Okeania]NET13988.1 hypothetical protein [Okeania sp. SIO1H6]NEP75307.1 hypothetical protein [Okeania sp. SIO2G5]NEP96385.1 hypothetical protein [Okeania sp. SIO2F5]NEQ94170.1 hypothetical protein [Okeania sp. SIO2G4]NES77627.1 hypothetical protein [Okeania sp. SIO1H4]
MKLLLKQTRATIRKSLGVIRKGLSFGEILDNKALIGTHHKTGTVWMLTIFSAIGSDYDLKFCREKNKAALRGSSKNFGHW